MLGHHIWVRPRSPVQASCEIPQVVLFNANMGEEEMGLQNILFRECGVVDKTLHGKRQLSSDSSAAQRV
ncbi:hypothetical protein VZT92_004394 [Zoarces viviparus]|uniref:Uncharacterized protein n=1 Tax=Zoarces viviparus TaxID=48416 RepID=A0AAW1FXH9_ZOAVI